VQGADKVALVSPSFAGGGAPTPPGPSDATVRIHGLTASEQLNDVQIKATWTAADGAQECSDMLELTVISVALAFRADGYWTGHDPNPANNDPAQGVNDAPLIPELGPPRLGVITSTSPPVSLGFFKNIEISATITPCIDGLECVFDFKRLKQGWTGDVINGAFEIPANVPQGANCPPPNWCDDDPAGGFQDEDLELGSPPACRVFVWDSPGWITEPGNPNLADGAIRLNCKQFREWLEVDGYRATNDKLWHASTEITWINGEWLATNGVAGNVVGEGGGEVFSCPAPPGAAQPIVSENINFSDMDALLNQLRSDNLIVRRNAQRRIANAVRDGAIQSKQDRNKLVSELIRQIQMIEADREPDNNGDRAKWDSAGYAVFLLGELRAEQAIPVLIKHVQIWFPGLFETPMTPAMRALLNIGEPAVGPIIEQAAIAPQKQWKALGGVLRGLDARSPLVRQTMRTMLDAQAWFESVEAAGGAPAPSDAERARRARVKKRLTDFLSTPEPDRPAPIISALPRSLEPVAAVAR